MWFDGQARPMADPGVFFGVKSGKSFTGKPLASGFPGGPGAPKPWSVTFPKAGTYEMSCPLFPTMTGTITVVGKGAAVPSAKADLARAKAQVKAAAKRLKSLAKQAAPEGDVVTAGPDAPTGEVLYRFTPAKKTVAVGAPVTLTMGEGSHEFHTFTFYTNKAAAKKLAQNSLAPLPGTGKNGPPVMGLDPIATLRSAPAGSPLTDDGTTGGYVNTGLLDRDPHPDWPASDVITFTKAGTYTYLCLLHPEMQGTITAQYALARRAGPPAGPARRGGQPAPRGARLRDQQMIPTRRAETAPACRRLGPWRVLVAEPPPAAGRAWAISASSLRAR